LINFILLELFASCEYLIYFFLLLFVSFIFYQKNLLFEKKKLFYFSVYWLLIYLLTLVLQERFYDIYIDYNFTFLFAYKSEIIIYFLSGLHLLILFLLGYNKSKKAQG